MVATDGDVAGTADREALDLAPHPQVVGVADDRQVGDLWENLGLAGDVCANVDSVHLDGGYLGWCSVLAQVAADVDGADSGGGVGVVPVGEDIPQHVLGDRHRSDASALGVEVVG